MEGIYLKMIFKRMEQKEQKMMKCTDAWLYERALRNHMVAELRKAIEAHGGSYSWYSEDEEDFTQDPPIVMCNRDYGGGPTDVKVRRVWVDESGYMQIEAEENEYGDEVYISFDDVVAFHIVYIIENIPATDEISDVTLPFDEFQNN